LGVGDRQSGRVGNLPHSAETRLPRQPCWPLDAGPIPRRLDAPASCQQSVLKACVKI
jgi:hypothetical protein